ncbi:MAG: STAS domain-containing protein [Candidatus Eremiobacteraeota bacterium]|nr:STAS domain-containing protein [Candidatus Eremiobacteraeota bacterium]
MLCLEMRGSWDGTNIEQLTKLCRRRGDGRDVLVDLRRVTYCDSTVLTQLIRLHQQITADGWRFEIVTKGGPVHRLFTVTRLDRLFEANAERVAALADPGL